MRRPPLRRSLVGGPGRSPRAATTMHETADTSDASAPDGTAPAGTERHAAPPATSGAADCAAGKTLDDGALTIATGEPAFPPYVIDDAPEIGRGLRGRRRMAVAARDGLRRRRRDLGPHRLRRRHRSPAPKDFDFNLQQFTITPERAEIVDVQRAATTRHRRRSSASPTRRRQRRHHDRRSARTQDRRRQPAPPASTYVEEVIQPDAGAADLQRQRGRQAGARERPDRRHRQRPADRAVHHRRRDRGHAVFGQFERQRHPTSSACCSSKDNPLVDASTSPSPRSTSPAS